MLYRGTAGHENDEGALPSDEVDEQLKEGIDGEGLVDVSKRLDPAGRLNGHQTGPGAGRVDGDHE